MKIRKFALVKYDYDSFPKDWKKLNPNPYNGITFCYLGDIPNMPGHSIVLSINNLTSMPYRPCIFHKENLKELSEDET